VGPFKNLIPSATGSGGQRVGCCPQGLSDLIRGDWWPLVFGEGWWVSCLVGLDKRGIGGKELVPENVGFARRGVNQIVGGIP